MTRWRRTLGPATALLLAAIGAGAGSAEAQRREKVPRAANADELLIVDCLLPPKVRRLGRRSTFLAPRQPLRTTAVECRIRGGEYTEPDQANLGSALKVWLPQAESGDPEAQYYVGQMFERGLGVAPHFASAAQWYRRAAEQGYAPAQINLGSLYETGQGVEKDSQAALQWYRRAAGLSEELVVLHETEYSDLARAQDDLTTTREALDRKSAELEESQGRVTELEETVEELEARPAPPPRPRAAKLKFGTFHALVVGNGEYATLPALPTAVEDARRVAELLETQYGYRVNLLTDATRFEILSALNTLREELTAEDNLLLYYAGHATRDPRGTSAYWQPVDAAADNPANWIPSEVVAEHLDLLPARHVLVVADSLFSGLRTRSSVATLPRGMTEDERFHHVRLLREKRCRLVLTSGRDHPGTPADGEEHSPFATALLDQLTANQGILEASAVYQDLARKLGAAGAAATPEFASMRWARNEVAEFFFVRSAS